MKFIVSCDHKASQYRLDNEPVTIRQDGFDGRYYWSHPKYGCSKSYETPTDAMMGMLCDHACFNIKIREA
jgi:hypothetical protein